MYIPKNNLVRDQSEIVAFIKQFSFATIITTKDNFPVATHLPFLPTIINDQVITVSGLHDEEDHKIIIEVLKGKYF